MPYLSIIIPARNSQKTITQTLEAVRNSHYQDYELIVVDSASTDDTATLASGFADKVIHLESSCSGRSQARLAGIQAAEGQVIVNIDSDVVIAPDTLVKIKDYFSRYQDVDALTGLLAKQHPHQNFFSQYKNLYMHYIFKKLPQQVTFLYGSIHALRTASARLCKYDEIKIADDTGLGQKLLCRGGKIAFLSDLEVVHLKKYNLSRFIKNDFQIPFDWAKIFLKYKGWRQLGKNKTGFAHASKGQLLSVVLAPAIVLFSLAVALNLVHYFLPLLLALIWSLLNLPFAVYLNQEKGLTFGILAFFVTFFDHIIMALGICCGFAHSLIPFKGQVQS